MNENRPGILWKLIPLLLVLLVCVAGGTDVFTTTVHALVAKALKDLGATVLPFAINCVIGLVVVSIANHLYNPLLSGVHKLLDSSHTNEHTRLLMRRMVKGFYWLVVAFLVLSIISPQLIGSVLGHLVLFGGAVILALQDLAKDAAGGFLLLFTPKEKRRFEIGDKIQLVGLEAVTGAVLDIDLLTSQVQTEKGLSTVPNREFLARTVIKLNPEPSKIIMPPGVERPKIEEKPAEKPADKGQHGIPALLAGLLSSSHQENKP